MSLIRRDPERLQKLRTAVRYLLSNDAFERGYQSRLAEHFDVSRQRVNQVVAEEMDRSVREAALRRIGRQRRQAAAIEAMFPQPRSIRPE